MATPSPAPPKILLFFLLLALAVAVQCSTSSELDVGGGGNVDYDCVYTVFVRTGSAWKGGTDSAIGVEFAGADGRGVRIADLERWGGLMGARHDYYERGNLDAFSGRGPCLPAAPCWMNLTSDGAGARHGWYCSYVEVTATGPHRGCAQRRFDVEQWLATDASPYRLTAVRDRCRSAGNSAAA
ncbi:PLAT domain-containing protein 3-like [Oryza brachyantha]|uniref:PLAT domain-containing protein 3-like n=1 Tax=Oryza brachyantha TaxID=4533 RepID=UPI001ADD4C88|nr:PLAT domain-containing protein 3-like [Oryza brachyantha]